MSTDAKHTQGEIRPDNDKPGPYIMAAGVHAPTLGRGYCLTFGKHNPRANTDWPHYPDPETAKANIARLVHCWNCHDELLEALEGLYTLCPQGHANDQRGLWADARAAIAKAKAVAP